MKRRPCWQVLFMAVVMVATLTVTGCSILASIMKSNLNNRWIPECGAGNHDECCRNCLGEGYVCTGTRFNQAGQPEIECSQQNR